MPGDALCDSVVLLTAGGTVAFQIRLSLAQTTGLVEDNSIVVVVVVVAVV